MRGEGWWCGNPSGRRPNFIGRQHLTFDKGGKVDGDLLHFAKPAKRSLKGKSVGDFRWIVRFCEGLARCEGW